MALKVASFEGLLLNAKAAHQHKLFTTLWLCDPPRQTNFAPLPRLPSVSCLCFLTFTTAVSFDELAQGSIFFFELAGPASRAISTLTGTTIEPGIRAPNHHISSDAFSRAPAGGFGLDQVSEIGPKGEWKTS